MPQIVVTGLQSGIIDDWQRARVDHGLDRNQHVLWSRSIGF
jgi:hypothetical protein